MNVSEMSRAGFLSQSSTRKGSYVSGASPLRACPSEYDRPV
ncbi:hypothetical protein SCATT_17190 [Streptantibioticus cattleyicolor NRRL 8057 = DSM 46488]|uniref:Uncharacterized protein n=1 Tax=Streptantibioticus cattleyicolor (strain ATCC 35852 / DSM 46488 / JCM 4925 / NBRC 14057 / NRRL 8057) TaxID=1003195 RepID=G8WP57_STREN|nr:hypothetical protein SCATT_17190 [Streptantibioticus cattleyicolor NRRL 8057 = DSM 46488]